MLPMGCGWACTNTLASVARLICPFGTARSSHLLFSQIDMIVCPNCDHHNPEGATQCEACYTPLPEMVPCPNCGAPVQVDANFCGQCGFNIQAPAPVMPPAVSAAPVLGNDLPTALEAPGASPGPAIAPSPILPTAEHELEALDVEAALAEEFDLDSDIDPEGGLDFEADLGAAVEASAALGPTAETPAVSSPPAPTPGSPPTQLQLPRAKLLHIRSNVTVDLPESLSVVHLGKANDRIPPRHRCDRLSRFRSRFPCPCRYSGGRGCLLHRRSGQLQRHLCEQFAPGAGQSPPFAGGRSHLPRQR